MFGKQKKKLKAMKTAALDKAKDIETGVAQKVENLADHKTAEAKENKD